MPTHGERGAAMMLAVLFVMVVLTTSALVMTILLSQALPYRNNKENAQVGYAAESGLEVALSFLREAEASKDYKKLLPSTASNTGNASLMRPSLQHRTGRCCSTMRKSATTCRQRA